MNSKTLKRRQSVGLEVRKEANATEHRAKMMMMIGNVTDTEIRIVLPDNARKPKKRSKGITQRSKIMGTRVLKETIHTDKISMISNKVERKTTRAIIRRPSSPLKEAKRWQSGMKMSAQLFRRSEKSLIRNEIFKLIIATNRLTLKLEKPTTDAVTGRIRGSSTSVVTDLNGLALVINITAIEKEVGRRIRFRNEKPATEITFRSHTT